MPPRVYIGDAVGFGKAEGLRDEEVGIVRRENLHWAVRILHRIPEIVEAETYE